MKLLKHLLLLLLAFPLGSLTSGQSLAENDPSLSGNPPKLDVGITTCDDGSRWHGFVFQTIAGLPYVVESGDDLAGWTEVDTFYGLGQEQVVLMKQAPALPASSPSPSGPITPHPLVVRVPNAQVIMRRAIGGGTILSWRSLDDDSSRSHFFPTLIQDAGWNIMPGYTRRLGGYNFLICNPLVPQTPPTDSPTLGPKDTAMVTAFEASFEEMNADAAAAIARRRATPYVPSPPQEKRFWRVRVNWSLDSDLDGTPDWMEFAQLFAAGAGTNTVAGPEADPFNKDANHDGIPDGSQRSSDGDSINDDVDADKMDELIDWRKCPESRYAFFQVTPPEPAAGADYPPPPMGINNFGGILFQPGLWQAGVYSPLGNSATALAMNDVGNIISYRVVDGAAKTFWQHGISQTPVEVISGDFSASARFGIDDHAHVGQPFMDSFTPDGRFIVKTYEQTVENSWNIYERRLWRVDPASGAMSQSAIGPYFNFVQDPGYTWGYDLDAPMSLNGVSTPAGLQENRPPSHVTIMTSGTPLLSGNSDGEGEIRVLKNGMWQKPKNLKSATDVSPEGIVIHDGGVTPVWMNGFHRPLFALAPGLPRRFLLRNAAEGHHPRRLHPWLEWLSRQPLQNDGRTSDLRGIPPDREFPASSGRG